EALEDVGEQVGDGVDGDHEQDEVGAAAEQREREDDGEPDGSERADVREPDEHRVEDAGPVVDDEAFEVAVERSQTGTICFVWSIRCWRSNGLPRKPLAPRLAASPTDRSSTFPLK